MVLSFKQEIDSLPHRYSRINFDALKNTEKVFNAYRIPASEEILAYMKSSVFLMGITMDGVIITDQALYFHPCHDNWAPTNRFAFAEICRYITVQENEKAAAHLVSAEGDYTIWGNALLSKNTSAMELLQFIRDLQQLLVNRYDWAEHQRKEAIGNLLHKLRTEMSKNTLDEMQQKVLDVIIAESIPYYDAVRLKAENIFRTFNPASYEDFLSRIDTQKFPKLREELSGGQQVFFNRLLHDLSDTSLVMSDTILKGIYDSFSAENRLSEIQCRILLYTCARLGKNDSFITLYNQAARRFGSSVAQDAIFFKAKYNNLRMREAFIAIAQGEMPLDSSLEWTDSLGFSPLHYAILLRKDQLVYKLLDKKKWRSGVPDGISGETANYYDFNTLACCIDLPDRAAVYRKTSELIEAQERSKRALERKIWFKKRSIDIQERSIQSLRGMIQSARSKNAAQGKISVMEEKLETFRVLRADVLAEIDELEYEIRSIDAEIHELTQYGLLCAADYAQQLQTSSDPLARLIRKIVYDPLVLLHILGKSNESCRLYSYGSFTFATPADVQIDLPYIVENAEEDSSYQKRPDNDNGDNQQENSDDSIVRPYGNSWFSPQAHQDMQKLKEEYRKLAKQYHPDVCTRKKSKQIFQEILNERATILEGMNANDKQ